MHVWQQKDIRNKRKDLTVGDTVSNTVATAVGCVLQWGKTKRCGVLALFLLVVSSMTYADLSERLYHMEIGIDGGCGYYAGDAERFIFQDIREAYGASIRYQLDRRWGVRVKGMAQRITGYNPNVAGRADTRMGMWTNQLVNIDAVGEFNFFPYGRIRYDRRISPITPYIALGLGVGLHSNWKKASAYVPFIVGLKWQPHPRVVIHAAWQHNVYFADNLETVKEYDNRYNMNGTNILNCDVTGQLVAGIAFSFLQYKLECRTCK